MQFCNMETGKLVSLKQLAEQGGITFPEQGLLGVSDDDPRVVRPCQVNRHAVAASSKSKVMHYVRNRN